MARIGGVDLPKDKRIEIGLTYIYGVGRSTSNKILKDTGVNPNIRVSDLSEADAQKIRDYIAHEENEILIEGSLRGQFQMNMKRLRDIASYRGLRHRKGLPVRGQRTKTNARTRKGPKRTAVKKKRKV
ncbi:30S ribosomal protein S13 [bacterium]|nr:30S ribosomal protein S13 [bacterium]MBL7052395.1 30S ribosomal protein S13 [Candidatus Neomarinimicrobiota bacterium]